MIYFDHNATTPIDPLVFETMQPFLTTFYGNPSSLHRHGRAVKTAIEQARQYVADLVCVSPNQIVFTSGGTEANNIAVLVAKHLKKKTVLFGSTEHPSISEPIKCLVSQSIQVKKIAVNSNGLVSANALGGMLDQNVGFVSLMQANNETGVIQNIAPLAALAQDKGIVFHTDAVQTAGKLSVDFNALNVNLMTLSSHKIYGPSGVGALVHDNETNLFPLSHGGGQEAGIRPGTENVAAIIGFGKAAQLALQSLTSRVEHLLGLRERLEKGIADVVGLEVVGSQVERLPNTCQILMHHIDGEMLLMQLDQKSIAISSGSACSSNSKEPSPVLKAMAYNDKRALSAIRVSFGQQNTLEEVDIFVATLKAIVS